jgi:hypothetical protein
MFETIGLDKGSKSLAKALPINFSKIQNKDKVKKFKFTISPDSKIKPEVMKQRINDQRLYSGKWTIPKIECKIPKKKKEVVKKVVKVKKLPPKVEIMIFDDPLPTPKEIKPAPVPIPKVMPRAFEMDAPSIPPAYRKMIYKEQNFFIERKALPVLIKLLDNRNAK